MSIAEHLEWLANRELGRLSTYLLGLSNYESCALLIEACRCLDHAHVIQHLAPDGQGQVPTQDFDIIVRGWKVLLALILPRLGGFGGIPLKESVPELRQAVMGMMHAAGRYVVINRAAEMLRHEMITAASHDSEIELALNDRTELDHFHDQVDFRKLAVLNNRLLSTYRPVSDPDKVRELRADMARLVFPWRTSQGVMVGYNTEPSIDDHFIQVFLRDIIQWRDESGIHPEAQLGGCTGACLTAVVLALMSFKLKHIMFVEEASRRYPDVNRYMSLTIWKYGDELTHSVAAATGLSDEEVRFALNFMTVKAIDAPYFMNEQAPGVPLLLQISDGYTLSLVSSIFRNPLNDIRMMRETGSPSMQNAFRKDRENWMTDDLYGLFEGPRFQCVPGPVRLRRDGQTITDIDAAIHDRTSGDVALFQLKWQDFASSNVRSQRSKAKNFVEQVEQWAVKTTTWIEQFGIGALLRALKLNVEFDLSTIKLRLVVVGRSNARFRSYGFKTSSPGLIILPWTQLVRLRYEIGPGQNVFGELAARVQTEAEHQIARTPLPYVMDLGDCKITFKDIWNEFEDLDGKD